MASIEDRWWRTVKDENGNTKKEKTERYGVGSRWLVRWRDPDGTPRKKSFTKKALAEAQSATVEADKLRGTYLDIDAGRATFTQYAEDWRDGQFTDTETAAQFELRLRIHVYPVIGHLELRKIKPSTIRRLLAGIKASDAYKRTIFVNTSQIFNAAVADNLIARNPCNSPVVPKPTVPTKHLQPWTTKQVAAVRAQVPERYRPVVTLGARLGLRQGESFGLSPDDIDFLRGTVTVRRQVKLNKGNRPYFAPPKGRKERTVPLPSSVRDTLAAYLAAWPARTVTLPWGTPDGQPVSVPLVLTTRESKPVNRHYFNARVWKPALRAAGVPATRENGCHMLRHTYGSLLLDGGESIKVVSARLGHVDPGFTLRVYVHLLPDTDRRTQDIIDAAFADDDTISGAPDVPHTGDATL